jgi:hypothetical protein
MSTYWELLRAAEPYAKIIEYLAIAVALLATMYSSHKIQVGAREIDGLENRLTSLFSRMRQAADEAARDFEDRVDHVLKSLKGTVADNVEREKEPDGENQEILPSSPVRQEQSSGVDAHKAAHQQWWQPIVDMKFDDPGQVDQPRLHWMNNTRTPLPWPGTWLTAWRNDSPDGVCGVALSGRAKRIDELWRRLRRDADQIQRELPEGSTVEGGRFGIGLTKSNSEFRNDDERREWLKATLNTFVNVLRPRVVKVANRANPRTGNGVAVSGP